MTDQPPLTDAHIDWLREKAERTTATVHVSTESLRHLLAALTTPCDCQWDWLCGPDCACVHHGGAK